VRLAVPVVSLAFVAAVGLPQIVAQVTLPSFRHAVVEKVATVGMEAPDTSQKLSDFGAMVGDQVLGLDWYYLLENGTLVFWADAKGNGKHALFVGPGLFSARDGQIKSLTRRQLKTTASYLEGLPEPVGFGDSNSSEPGKVADIKNSGELLFITLGFSHGLTGYQASVCAWDGDKMRPVLWRNESPAWLGAGDNIEVAEVVNVNPDRSALIVYSSKNGQHGIALYSKDAGLRPLIAAGAPLPGMPGQSILKSTFEHLSGNGPVSRKGNPAEREKELRRTKRWRTAAPIVLGDWLFLLVESSSGHSLLARMGRGRTERILEEDAPDPTEAGTVVEEIRSFRAITPDVVAVEVGHGKGDPRLLLSDHGKISQIHKFAVPAPKESLDRESLHTVQTMSPETGTFCAFIDDVYVKNQYGAHPYCFDGVKMSNVSGSAPLGIGTDMKAIPGLPDTLVIHTLLPTREQRAHCTLQSAAWIASGKEAGHDLQPALEAYSAGDIRYTLADVVGIDAGRKTIWLKLCDGFYKVRDAGN
jgi:hypothetical protein